MSEHYVPTLADLLRRVADELVPVELPLSADNGYGTADEQADPGIVAFAVAIVSDGLRRAAALACLRSGDRTSPH